MTNYGMELILDIHHCDANQFTRVKIDEFFTAMCKLLNMQQCERFWWDEEGVPDEQKQTSPRTKGMSAIQFILTSNITIHTLDDWKLGSVFLNIFSCKEFDSEIAAKYAMDFFGGIIKTNVVVMRQ